MSNLNHTPIPASNPFTTTFHPFSTKLNISSILPIPYLPHIPADSHCHHQPPSIPPKNEWKFTCFDQCVYLVQAKVSVAFSNGFAESVREWIQHAVVWVHWRQAVLIQLVSHNAHKLLHPLIIICPVAHNLGEWQEWEKLENKLLIQQKQNK